jgi:electron transfer flavoprotein alpha subunit
MRNPDLRAAVVGAIIEALRPRYTVFAESDAGGGDLGRRIAARLGMPIATNCWRVGPDRCCRSNSAGTIDYELPTPAIITMQANALTPTHAVIRDASILDLPLFPADDLRIEFVEDVVNPADQIPLAEAEFVLSGGNGVSDWALFRRLAARLGAAMGGSRVAVDEGHLPPDRQVGSTGTQTVASVYLAVGISGAAQHLQGIVDCESVISVNHDPGCDMTRRADLGIVGDADAIMHALVERLEQNNDAADLSARV